MATVALTERPSVYCREDAAVVIFPSKPYWFSATKEIVGILDAYSLGEPQRIIEDIASKLGTDLETAGNIFADTAEMLRASGVLAVDGVTEDVPTYAPDFQVNEVENVLVIATTQRCNMSCAMCYADAHNPLKQEMSSRQIKAIIDQLGRMPWQNGISRVALTGGELFTREDALELIGYVQEKGYFAQVNTNATLLTHNHIRRLAEFPRLKMSISLDGSRPELHDAIRGQGMFEATTSNIRALCNGGVSVAVNMFVHAGNLDDIGDTLRLADSLGAQRFNCLNMMHVGRANTSRAKRHLEAVPLAMFYRKLFETIRHEPRLQEMMMDSTFANQLMGVAAGVKSHSCGIGTNRAVYVKADGSLYPCADTALPDFRLGNLLHEELGKIWEASPMLKRLRTLDVDTMNAKCAACDVRYVCGGNCRGENYQTTGDISCPHFKCEEIHASILELMWILTEEPDLFRCKVSKLYETVSTHASSA